MELMPWQVLVATVATEYDPETGFPFYREIFVTTPRQAGKTTLILILLIVRCLSQENQACVWTGQDGQSIKRKWFNEIIPLLERTKLFPLISMVRKANGSESLKWETGSRIELLPTSETAGHGMVLDFAVMDEIFSDQDNRREAALVPAMATKQDAQILTCSTAGTAASLVYNRKVRLGRAAVAEGKDFGFAYFEWSAPAEWDQNDDKSFELFHPAFNRTIFLPAVQAARDSLEGEAGEFARAWGNRPQVDSGSVFPAPVWARCVSRSAAPDLTKRVTIGVDAPYDRDFAAVALCDSDGTVGLFEYRPGVEWVVDHVEKLSKEHKADIVFDARGPAGSIDGLNKLKKAKPFNARQVIEACAGFYDAVADQQITVRQDPDVEAAIAGLAKKDIGDSNYVWHRKASSQDVSPLYAITLAFAGSREPSKRPVQMISI